MVIEYLLNTTTQVHTITARERHAGQSVIGSR
jgi:hypothetical protein